MLMLRGQVQLVLDSQSSIGRVVSNLKMVELSLVSSSRSAGYQIFLSMLLTNIFNKPRILSVYPLCCNREYIHTLRYLCKLINYTQIDLEIYDNPKNQMKSV